MAPTSASLLERLNDRADSDAWSRMVDLYSPMIRSWLGRCGLAEPDIDDISQTVLSAVVANLPKFQHNGRAGAFRRWLRTITVNSLRDKFRRGRNRSDSPGGSAFLSSLNELEDPESGLSQIWDRFHDEHVARTLLAWAEPEFEPKTWQAFRRQVIEESRPATVAAELEISLNAVVIAKCRVLKRLRELSHGLIDQYPAR
jgi:RNA polymerase sigma-70 factor (ECF subfamily)